MTRVYGAGPLLADKSGTYPSTQAMLSLPNAGTVSTWSAYQEFTASTSTNIIVIGVIVWVESSSNDRIHVKLATGSAGSETDVTGALSVKHTGVTNDRVNMYFGLSAGIYVPEGTRISGAVMNEDSTTHTVSAKIVYLEV